MMKCKTQTISHFLLVRISLVLMTILMLNACSTIRYDGVQVNKEGRTVVSRLTLLTIKKSKTYTMQ